MARTFLALFLALSITGVASRKVHAQNASRSPATENSTPLTAKVYVQPTLEPNYASWVVPVSEATIVSVVEFNRNSLVHLKDGTSSKISIPADRVEAIEFTWSSDLAQKSDRSRRDGKFKEAIDFAKQAIASGEVPRWQQRFLAASIVDCLVQSNQNVAAIKVFISLAKESPPPLLYASLPLNWSLQKADPALEQISKEWLSDSSTPLEQLCGASWLIQSEQASQAKSVLVRLTKDPDSMIVSLAKSQLWRTATPAEVRDAYPSWIRERNRMLMSIQCGPTIAIASKLERASLKEEALDQWLTLEALAVNRDADRALAVTKAREILIELGQQPQADRLK